MLLDQLFEVVAGCANPPPTRRISSCLKQSMSVILVNSNHPAASNGHKMVGGADTTCAHLPPLVAKAKATAVMHDAHAPAHRHQHVDVASVAAASVATATGAAAGPTAVYTLADSANASDVGNIASPAISANSSSSSDSEDSKMSGGSGTTVGCWVQDNKFD